MENLNTACLQWGEIKMVSIIVPVYNAEKTLCKCIDSILGQTFEDIEVLLINDGSKDNSEKICLEYASKDARVKYFFQENSGPSAARNKGLEEAKGQYIQFVDSDDFIEENMTEKLVNEMLKSNVDLVICGYKAVGMKNTKQIRYIPEIFSLDNGFFNIVNSKQRFGEFHSLCTKLYKREKITTFFNPEYVLAEDFVFNMHYLKNIKSVSVLDECLYNYMAGSESVTRFNYRTNEDMISKQNKEIIEIYKQKNASDKEIAILYYQWYMKLLKNFFYENKSRGTLSKFRVFIKRSEFIFNEFFDTLNINNKELIAIKENKLYKVYISRKFDFIKKEIKQNIKYSLYLFNKLFWRKKDGK